MLDSTNPQPRESNASLDSRSAEKKENNPPKEETVSPKVETSPGFRSDGDGAKMLAIQPLHLFFFIFLPLVLVLSEVSV